MQVKTAVFRFITTATSYIYTLSLHDALPIFICTAIFVWPRPGMSAEWKAAALKSAARANTNSFRESFSLFVSRSEEHTSELQSRFDLVCRLLLEKKNIGNVIAQGVRSITDKV